MSTLREFLLNRILGPSIDEAHKRGFYEGYEACRDKRTQLQSDLNDAHRDAMVNRDTANRLQRIVDAVETLHIARCTEFGQAGCSRFPHCHHCCVRCGEVWPCSTAAILDGER